MIRTALLILATVVALASSPPAARAANPPFTWATFPTANGNQSFPQWLDAGNGNRTLVSATGTLNFAQTPAVTAVTFQVFTQGPQGGWNATPVINYPLNPLPQFTGMPINGWTLVGKDPNSPSTVFTEGQQIQVV
jgi:hypothetical protein